ncbi:uncharacterized protein ZHAS_00013088 [Anopheles sinensis]|uniref:Uncharacterized protein n=1 Tax=Anopheles sinensis TaxID=74873 RepID=A0A084W4V6_ANOSI|nr:uncharacterized protein ZHAS_00013088 [Anopheles sinensis]
MARLNGNRPLMLDIVKRRSKVLERVDANEAIATELSSPTRNGNFVTALIVR